MGIQASETFKALLTFTLVALGGALIKGAVDASLDEQRAHRSHSEQSKERQTEIVTEFVEVFSQFYGVRKLYHSAHSESNKLYVKPSEAYAVLIKELLKKSVELEGRYGALKTLTIQHFGLPDSNLRTKIVVELEKRLGAQQDIPTLMRLRLDLLGELYDDWRHAIEQKREITVGSKVWENYEVLLKYLIEADTPQREGARNGVKSQVL